SPYASPYGASEAECKSNNTILDSLSSRLPSGKPAAPAVFGGMLASNSAPQMEERARRMDGNGMLLKQKEASAPKRQLADKDMGSAAGAGADFSDSSAQATADQPGQSGQTATFAPANQSGPLSSGALQQMVHPTPEPDEIAMVLIAVLAFFAAIFFNKRKSSPAKTQ
ncbi:MAG: hypothetical protein K2Z81_12865, partial [Cyanobacteria bacterium]|nr:hypothetical protein [Cyanobacteriota bacterium]